MNPAIVGHMAASEAERGHMSPYEIGILLHYYAIPGDHPDMTRYGPPTLCAWPNAIRRLLDDELLEMLEFPEEQSYKLTNKGQFYVREGLCKVPLPIVEFRIPYDQA